VPTDHWPVRLPSGPVHAPSINIDDVDPVMIAQSRRKLWRNRLTSQGTDRCPDGRHAKLLAGDPVNHLRSIMTKAVDINRWRISHDHEVLGLNRRKLISPRLQHRWMSYHNQLRPDQTIADEEPRPATADLLTDTRINRPQPRHKWAIHMNQTGRPADLRLRDNLLRQTMRSAPREPQIRQHQDINLPAC
jgi:hypothetical protein